MHFENRNKPEKEQSKLTGWRALGTGWGLYGASYPLPKEDGEGKVERM